MVLFDKEKIIMLLAKSDQVKLVIFQGSFLMQIKTSSGTMY